MTNSDCPVTLIHPPEAIFLSDALWGKDDCVKNLGLFLLTELNLVCVSSAQEEKSELHRTTVLRARPELSLSLSSSSFYCFCYGTYFGGVRIF